MMVVYINMETPTRCWDCPCADKSNGVCEAVVGGATIWDDRPHWCPLIPVPPHGRLIAEADAIETAWMILTGLGYRKEENPQLEQTVREVFATAPGVD